MYERSSAGDVLCRRHGLGCGNQKLHQGHRLTAPEKTALRGHDSVAELRYSVLPAQPAGSDGMNAANCAVLPAAFR
ncbi:hypothetical protein GR167_02675 [Rhodobacteraceae bacterium GS-10]|uniref:Nitrile hydratase alpha/Thiocyanate hydrolase gamma domain-containing protein n=1 Tax=Thalassovita mangrovi TaxID=2692236 RepID=A0A6L8LDR8_9RHOB|nr:hypothetical protein [Thalassovita mangrovi]